VTTTLADARKRLAPAAPKVPEGFVVDEAGILRRSGLDDGRAQLAASKYGGGFRLKVTAQVKDGVPFEVRESISLAAGGSAPAGTVVSGEQLEAAKSAPGDRTKILQRSYELYISDPLGGQIAETTKHFLFGAGTTVSFEDKEAQKWVERFRRKNQMGEKEKCLGAMSVYQGDLYLWLRPILEDMVAGKRKVDIKGDTRLTLIDPQNITAVEHDPTDVSNVYFFHFEYKDPDTNAVVPMQIRPFDKYDPVADADKGCIIQIKFNSDPNDPFGYPDFVRIGEWLENYKEYLRDGVIINKLYRSPCYDITIVDGDEQDVQRAISRYKGWKIGSNPVHNDKEVWEVMEFTGPNSSQSEARRAILLVIAAGVGFAEYMLADGSNANLASTTTQELPVLKKFEARQGTFKTAFELLYQIVLMHAAVYGGLSESFDDFGADYLWKGSVEFPNLIRSEESAVEEVNASAVASGYMSKRTAAKRLGLSLDDEFRRREDDAEREADIESKIQKARLSKGLDQPVEPAPGTTGIDGSPKKSPPAGSP
jgi:hypothetical protein